MGESVVEKIRRDLYDGKFMAAVVYIDIAVVSWSMETERIAREVVIQPHSTKTSFATASHWIYHRSRVSIPPFTSDVRSRSCKA